jgi:hypothetical protein
MDGLDDAFLTVMGEISFVFADLESSLAFHTWLLIDPKRLRTGIVITAGMDFRRLTEMFATLVLDRTDPDEVSEDAERIRKGLKALVSQLDQAREERNRIVHSQWCTSAIIEKVEGDDRSSIIVRIKHTKDQRKGWQMQFEAWKLARFKTILAQIQSAKLALALFAAAAQELKGMFPRPEDNNQN